MGGVYRWDPSAANGRVRRPGLAQKLPPAANGNGNEFCFAGKLSVVGRGFFVAVTVNVAVIGS